VNHPHPRRPTWLAKRAGLTPATGAVRRIVREGGLNTVCQSARCPNLGECFAHGTATFMILGAACARACGFCAVATARPEPVDADEPERVAAAAAAMGLTHVVVTSVTRDDLADGGAPHFAATIATLRTRTPLATVEVLTPDFGGDVGAIDTVIDAAPDVYNHNVETVSRLYPAVRPQAVYARSLALIRRVADRAPTITTKSGIMVGLGETADEVRATMTDLKRAGCDVVTIGQYLQPTRKNLPVAEYVAPEVFDEYRRIGEEEIGLATVFAAPYVRSSYHAGELLKKTSKL
jgi:lipoic acid synthetase